MPKPQRRVKPAQSMAPLVGDTDGGVVDRALDFLDRFGPVGNPHLHLIPDHLVSEKVRQKRHPERKGPEQEKRALFKYLDELDSKAPELTMRHQMPGLWRALERLDELAPELTFKKQWPKLYQWIQQTVVHKPGPE